jgi:hypothetical protein
METPPRQLKKQETAPTGVEFVSVRLDQTLSWLEYQASIETDVLSLQNLAVDFTAEEQRKLWCWAQEIRGIRLSHELLKAMSDVERSRTTLKQLRLQNGL